MTEDSMKMGEFAQTILNERYAQVIDGRHETLTEIGQRCANEVGRSVGMKKALRGEIARLITLRKFLPGGRYLAQTGKPYHQVNNCLMLRAEDSREGWAELMHNASLSLMTGAGIGVNYSRVRPEGKPIRKTGGTATGPLALMQMVNESARWIRQGGTRRAALWAGLNWKHADIHKFITLKNWIPEVRALKAKNVDFPAAMDITNISICLDDEFFEAYNNDFAAYCKRLKVNEPMPKGWEHPHNSLATSVYRTAVERMLKTGEPGFSIDTGVNSGEDLRNAPVSGQTRVLTNNGYVDVRSIAYVPTTLWTGKHWAKDVVFKCTNPSSDLVEVSLSNGRTIVCSPSHPFLVKEFKGGGKNKKTLENRTAAVSLNTDDKMFSDLPKSYFELEADELQYGLGFMYGDGSIKNGKGELSVHTESKVSSYARACLGLNARHVSCFNRSYFKYPLYSKDDLLSSTLSPSFIAGWFDADGCFTRNLLRICCFQKKSLQFLQESLDLLGIKSVVREDGSSSYKPENKCYTLGVLADSLKRFQAIIPTTRINLNIDDSYEPYRSSEIRVVDINELDYREPVYCCDVRLDEHSFMAEGVLISNCTELCSRDDSDICNLGSINMSRIDTLEEMREVTEIATAFLLAGTVYSDVPYAKVDQIRTKNRRLGLGLMGIHEWLLKHGKKYEQDVELEKYLEIYKVESSRASAYYADQWEISKPVKCRAIAPTGTVSIVAETTSGIEPILVSAYKRYYYKGAQRFHQYVIDPTAKKLIDSGIHPDSIEDAYTLAETPERRIVFQEWVQKYVDHSISSTVNLPQYGSEVNNETTVVDFGNMMIKHLHGLRGITVYPDGARSGQPLQPISYKTAIKYIGEAFLEGGDVCDLTHSGGTCGS